MNLKDFIQKYDSGYYRIQNNGFILDTRIHMSYPFMITDGDTMCLFPMESDMGIGILTVNRLEVNLVLYDGSTDPPTIDFNPKFLESIKTYLEDNEGYIDEMVIIRLINILKVTFSRMIEVDLEMPLVKRAL